MTAFEQKSSLDLTVWEKSRGAGAQEELPMHFLAK